MTLPVVFVTILLLNSFALSLSGSTQTPHINYEVYALAYGTYPQLSYVVVRDRR